MIVPPCKGCTDRTIPKTCQETCKRWQEYEEKKKSQQKTIIENKRIEKRILDSIWRKK